MHLHVGEIISIARSEYDARTHKNILFYAVKLNNVNVEIISEECLELDMPELDTSELNKKAVYTVCNDEQNDRIQNIREAFSNLYNLIEEKCKPGRETSLGITKLEEAQFWAIKSISREE